MLINYLTWTLISIVCLISLTGAMLFVGGCCNIYYKKPGKLKTIIMMVGGLIFTIYPIIILVHWILTMKI